MLYKLYLAKDFMKYKPYKPCYSIEEVEKELELAQDSEYNYYLIVQHDIKTRTDLKWETGQIEHKVNKRLVKTPKLN
jgi:hypothetical protein